MIQPFRNFLTVVALSSLGACAQNNGPTQQADGSSMTTIQTKSGKINIQKLATFNQPWGMTFLPDGKLLITEKPGRLLIYTQGQQPVNVTGVPKVAYGGQGGLMDVELDPEFKTNKLVYLYFVEAGTGSLKGGAVARGMLENNELKNLQVIWRQQPKTTGEGHFGGRLVFSADRKLFITSGERQKFTPAQDTSVTLGKIIRINRDGSIPTDNPYYNKKGNRPETWSMGHRNPIGAALNPATARLWINEMGPKGGDEINIPEAGKNYGWPIVSNGSHYDGKDIPDHSTRPEFAAPVFSWNPSISPSGMIFYTGSLFPQWKGNAFLGALSGEKLIRLAVEGDKVLEEERIPLNKRIRDVIQAPDGAIWVITDYSEGELWRLTPGK